MTKKSSYHEEVINIIEYGHFQIEVARGMHTYNNSINLIASKIPLCTHTIDIVVNIRNLQTGDEYHWANFKTNEEAIAFAKGYCQGLNVCSN